MGPASPFKGGSLAKKPPTECVAIFLALWSIGLLTYALAVAPADASVITGWATVGMLAAFIGYETHVLRKQHKERERIAREVRKNRGNQP